MDEPVCVDRGTKVGGPGESRADRNRTGRSRAATGSQHDHTDDEERGLHGTTTLTMPLAADYQDQRGVPAWGGTETFENNSPSASLWTHAPAAGQPMIPARYAALTAIVASLGVGGGAAYAATGSGTTTTPTTTTPSTTTPSTTAPHNSANCPNMGGSSSSSSSGAAYYPSSNL